MKALYLLVGLLPLLSVAATKCECPLVKCGGTAAEICRCQNNAAISCYKRCGGPRPTLRPCPRPAPEPQACGSRGLPNCPDSQTCINDPLKPDCDIAADCPGICVRLDGPQCGGFAGFPCPEGKVCVDDPRDDCDPRHGGADCIGVCITRNAP